MSAEEIDFKRTRKTQNFEKLTVISNSFETSK